MFYLGPSSCLMSQKVILSYGKLFKMAKKQKIILFSKMLLIPNFVLEEKYILINISSYLDNKYYFLKPELVS